MPKRKAPLERLRGHVLLALFLSLALAPLPSSLAQASGDALATGVHQHSLQVLPSPSGATGGTASDGAKGGAQPREGAIRGLAQLMSDALGAGGQGTQVVAVCLFVFLLSICMVFGHLLEEVKWLNESVSAIFFGLLSGAVVLVATSRKSSHILRFDEDLFFIYLLPPIIFNAGFQVKKKQFFRNFGGIMLYGVFGVFVSVAVIAAGCSLLFPLLGLPGQNLQVYLVLGVVFSATDSVCTLQVLDQDEQPLLYSLVFGEGVVNDATSVVLFYALNHLESGGGGALGLAKFLKILLDFLYLFTTSTALGVALGLLSAFLIKTLYFGRHSTDREIALMVLMAYQSYVTAELLHLSGILAVFFCGIVMSHYTWHNVTESSRVTTKHSFATMSYIAETFIFIYVGMDALDADKWSQIIPRAAAGMFCIFMLLILLGRAAFIFPLSFLMNQYRKTRCIISTRHMVVIWWSGLMRGAVSIALIYRATSDFESKVTGAVESATAATMGVVLFSTLVFGTLTRPIIDLLVPHTLDRCTSLLTDRGSSPNHSGSFRETPFSPGKGNYEEGGRRDGSSGVYMPRDKSQETSPREVIAAAAMEGDASPPAAAAVSAPDVESSFSRGHRLVTVLTSGRERDLHDWWRWFDDSYMRPYFGGRGFMPVLPPSPTVSVHGERLDGGMLIRKLSLRAGPFASVLEAADAQYDVLHGSEAEVRRQGSVKKLEIGGDAVEGRHLADEPAWPETEPQHGR